jgi:23S rRNA (cytidine1920-2'-O)/16S rRNA (cytidine1409-2'-O)-methyltransferase
VRTGGGPYSSNSSGNAISDTTATAGCVNYGDMVRRQRLDRELLRLGLARSRAQAERLILDQQVTVNGAVALKPAHLVAASDAIVVSGAGQWRSRGYDKLQGALEETQLDVADAQCLDVGASTGGFVQALLDAGARCVVAVDVGTAQLDAKLRTDERVRVYEQTDIRSFISPFATPPDLITVDVSFISVTKIADALGRLAGPDTQLLVLIKPQFEVERAIASKHRGVIRDTVVHEQVLTTVLGGLAQYGLIATAVLPSKRRGAKGNQEYFAHLHYGQLMNIESEDPPWQTFIAQALGGH